VRAGADVLGEVERRRVRRDRIERVRAREPDETAHPQALGVEDREASDAGRSGRGTVRRHDEPLAVAGETSRGAVVGDERDAVVPVQMPPALDASAVDANGGDECRRPAS
jgi:hypothetical protein